MPGLTLTQAETQLATWIAADTAVAAGQSYDIGGKTYTRVNAKEIRENITYWDNMCKTLGGSGILIMGGTPVD